MAITNLADIQFLSSTFNDVKDAAFTTSLEFSNGLIQDAGNLITDLTGQTATLPKYNFTDATGSKINPGSPIVTSKLTQFADKAVWVDRYFAWSFSQVLRMIGNQDPTIAVGKMIGNTIGKSVQASAVKMSTGAFATALAGTHVYDDALNKININGITIAKQKIGDANKNLNTIVMSSAVETVALQAGILNYDNLNKDTYRSGEIGRIVGLSPFVSDECAYVGDAHYSIIGRPGSIVYKTRPYQALSSTNGNLMMLADGSQIELVRIGTDQAGEDQIVLRTSYLVHIPGVAWNSTANPEDTDLATGANWTKVQADNKDIQIVQYISSIV